MSVLAPWWVRREGVLQAELDALAALGLTFAVDGTEREARQRIVLRGEAPVTTDSTAPLAIVYPDTFPDTPPTVYRTDSGRLPRHQNPVQGNYCLLGRASRDWKPSMRAAHLVEKIPRLTELVEADGSDLLDAEEPQAEPVSAYLPYAVRGTVIVPEEALEVPDSAAGGEFHLRFARDPAWVEHLLFPASSAIEVPPRGQALLTSVSADGRELTADQQLAKTFKGPTWRGRWARMEAPPLTADPASFRQGLLEAIPPARPGERQKSGPRRYELTAVVFDEEIRQGEYGLAWVFCVTGALHGDLRRGRDRPGPMRSQVLRAQRYSRRELSQRIPELESFGCRTLTMVGLGSLGGPLARQLVRAQPGVLRVADHDVHEAGTSVRGPGGLSAAGIPKVEQLGQETAREHPYVTVVPYRLHIGAAPLDVTPDSRRDADVLAEMLTGTDIVIEATAEDHVRRAVAGLAQEMAIPQVLLWGIDGHGGVVARIRPGRTGCHHCLSLAQHDGTIPRPSSAARPTRVQPRGCADTTFAAADTEMLPLVNQASRLVFSTLCSSDPGGYPEIEGDVFVLQLRHPDGRALPTPSWTEHPLPVHPQCELCDYQATQCWAG